MWVRLTSLSICPVLPSVEHTQMLGFKILELGIWGQGEVLLLPLSGRWGKLAPGALAGDQKARGSPAGCTVYLAMDMDHEAPNLHIQSAHLEKQYAVCGRRTRSLGSS